MTYVRGVTSTELSIIRTKGGNGHRLMAVMFSMVRSVKRGRRGRDSSQYMRVEVKIMGDVTRDVANAIGH